MAKRFTFRFDTMLKIRRQREDEHKRVVADRIRQITQVQAQMASIDRQIRDETGAIRMRQEPGTIDIQQVLRRRHWLSRLHKSALEAEARRRFLEARLAQERAALAQAVKQRRILDKLKERQWLKYLSELQRRETRQSDELATVRYVFDRAAAVEVAT